LPVTLDGGTLADSGGNHGSLTGDFELTMMNIKGIAQKFSTQIKNQQPEIEDFLIRLKHAGAHGLSDMSQRTAGLKTYQRRFRNSLAKLCGLSLEYCGKLGQRIKVMRSTANRVVGPIRVRTVRRFHDNLRWLPFYPIKVAERPVPTTENPRIAKKVEAARSWMKARGISDDLPTKSMPSPGGHVAPKVAPSPEQSEEDVRFH